MKLFPSPVDYEFLYQAEKRNHHFEKSRADALMTQLKQEQARGDKLELEIKALRKPTVYCSFCGKSQHEVRKVIAGPKSNFICDECVRLALNVIVEDMEIKK